MPDPYDVLGIPPQATRDQIEQAYRQRVVQHCDDLRDLGTARTGRAETERRRLEGRVLRAYGAKRARDARRMSESALRENAEQMLDIERRILLAERDDAGARQRRWRLAMALRVTSLLVAGLALWLLWRR